MNGLKWDLQQVVTFDIKPYKCYHKICKSLSKAKTSKGNWIHHWTILIHNPHQIEESGTKCNLFKIVNSVSIFEEPTYCNDVGCTKNSNILCKEIM